MNNDQLFQTIATLLIPFGVALFIALAEKIGFVWAKVNQPTVAALLGAFMGAVYNYGPIYMAVHGTAPAGTLGDALQMGIMAGLAASGLKSMTKDAVSGAMGVKTEADVFEMRKKTQEKEIGS